MSGFILRLFHVQCGSNGGPDRLLQVVLRPPYNLAPKGVKVEEIAKQASHVIVTGMVTRNMLQILQVTLDQMSTPRIILVGEFDGFDRQLKHNHPLYHSPAFAKVPVEWNRWVVLRVIHDPLLPEHLYDALIGLL